MEKHDYNDWLAADEILRDKFIWFLRDEDSRWPEFKKTRDDIHCFQRQLDCHEEMQIASIHGNLAVMGNQNASMSIA